MKITIDTKEDSHHDIKKVIGMLQKLVGGAPSSSSLFEENSSEPLSEPTSEPQSEPSNAFFNMFGDNSPVQEPSSEPVSEPSSETSSILGDEPKSTTEEETSDDIPEIIAYE